MGWDLLEAKLESLRRCVEYIAAKTSLAADQLAQNPDLQDIIALNLQRAVQLSVDLASYLITGRLPLCAVFSPARPSNCFAIDFP